MKWYDLVAPVYDKAIQRMYLPYRQLAVRSLHLIPDLTVLDLGCGSGLNFELLIDEINTQGTILGVDFSAGMLERAQEKVNQHGWENVHLLQRDASSDISRRVWEPLQDMCENYVEERHTLMHGGEVVIASGMKPNN